MTKTSKKCVLCRATAEDMEQHILDHIDKSYAKESLAFRETQEARALYKKLFKKDI